MNKMDFSWEVLSIHCVLARVVVVELQKLEGIPVEDSEVTRKKVDLISRPIEGEWCCLACDNFRFVRRVHYKPERLRLVLSFLGISIIGRSPIVATLS
jgi:hypothetical protein